MEMHEHEVESELHDEVAEVERRGIELVVLIIIVVVVIVACHAELPHFGYFGHF